MKKGWEIKKLGDVCDEIFAGGDVPKNNFTKFKTDKHQVPIFSNGEKNKGLYGYTESARVTKPSITISARGTIGYSEIREEAFYPVVRLIVVIPNSKILDLFFLKHVISSIDFKHSGTSIPQLTVPMVREYQFSLPKLPEQKRIVKKLDEIFESIERGRKNTEKNINNAKELFKSYLENVFANQRKDWEDKNLGDVCKVIAGQSPEGKYYNKNAVGVPFYQGKKEFSNKHIKVPATWTAKVTKEAVAGDILMSVRAPVGPVNFATEKICIGRGLAAIRASKVIDKNYLFYYFINCENKIVGNEGAVFNSINKKQIENLRLSLPVLSEQKLIAQEIEALSDETMRLDVVYQKKLSNLEELKKTVLQKAFEGKL